MSPTSRRVLLLIGNFVGLAMIAGGLYVRHSIAEERAAEKAATEYQLAVTQQQLAEAKRQLAEERESAITGLLSATGYGIVALDRDHKIVEWSDGATKLFGWTKEEAIGTDAKFLMPPELLPVHHAAFAKAIVNPKRDHVAEVFCTANTKSGKKIDVRINVRMYPIGGRLMPWAIIDKAANLTTTDAREGK
jgi:PAS domain S-box-containing protein